MSLLAPLLLALVRPATVDVDIDALALPHAQSELLHGELMTRLVEEGHAVGRPAAITVRLLGGGEVVHVEVAHGSELQSRDVAGQGAILRLATIHAALELLASLPAVADADPALTSPPERALVIEIVDDADGRSAAAIAAAIDAGFVVTPAPADATRKACVGGRDGTTTLAVVASASACPEGTPVADLDTELANALRSAATPVITPAPVASQPVAIPPPTPAPVVTAPVRARPWSGAIGAAIGVEGRIVPVEPLVLVHGDARHTSGAYLTARASIAPTPSTSFAIADTFVTLGAGYGTELGKRWRLQGALAVGVAGHGYSVAGDRGGSIDATAELPIDLAIRLGARFELTASVIPGVSTRRRSHVRGREVLWSRDRWRVAGMLGVNVLLGRKPRPASSAVGS